MTRFEAFLKKIYWLREGEEVPSTADGRDPAWLDTVRHFPKVSALYSTRNDKFMLFKQIYHVVYVWRNKESHSAPVIDDEYLQTGLRAAVALYLYAAMVSAEDLKGKIEKGG